MSNKKKFEEVDGNLLDLNKVTYVTKPTYSKYEEEWGFNVGMDSALGHASVYISRKGTNWDTQNEVTNLHRDLTTLVIENG